jgi:hypothetical protein
MPNLAAAAGGQPGQGGGEQQGEGGQEGGEEDGADLEAQFEDVVFDGGLKVGPAPGCV